jgi:hypothetical protein
MDRPITYCLLCYTEKTSNNNNSDSADRVEGFGSNIEVEHHS